MVLGAIGQDETSFSPMQMAVYASTLATQGKRYAATFLNRVVSADYRSLILENEPELVSTLDISDSTYKAYLEGMIAVCHGNRGTARDTMKGLPVTVAGKTGTAQHGLGKDKSDHGAFVCFAPAENPQIAIAVYGEQAAHGATLGQVAAAIIQYYFDANGTETGTIVPLENTLG
jgi:penicillin-binding protein 2